MSFVAVMGHGGREGARRGTRGNKRGQRWTAYSLITDTARQKVARGISRQTAVPPGGSRFLGSPLCRPTVPHCCWSSHLSPALQGENTRKKRWLSVGSGWGPRRRRGPHPEPTLGCITGGWFCQFYKYAISTRIKSEKKARQYTR